jgi:putative DNA primase/helicase
MVVTNEIEDGTWLAESLVKLLTGGDRIAARHLYQEIFEFEPQFKLVIAGNHKPVVRNDDYGIWRRIQLIPFEVTIPTDQRDPNLPDKLRSELPGILSWALHGYHEWRARGLSPPAAETGAVETYRKEMDLFGQWLEECCDLNADLETPAMYAYACFKNWSAFNGFKGWTNARFGRKVKERFQSRRTADCTLYRGFSVKKDADLFWPRA